MRLRCVPTFAVMFEMAWVDKSDCFALYRMPLENRVQVVICRQPRFVQPNLESLGKGFLVGAFRKDPRGVLFLKADSWFDGENWHGDSVNNPSSDTYTSEHPAVMVYDVDYQDLVRRGVEAIRSGAMRKVVLSRCLQTKLPTDFDAVAAFWAAEKAYPTAFVALVKTPNYGLWLGASPEILLSMDKNGIFRTVALAGTQLRNGLEDLSQALWRQKEIEEQALVSRYIIDCFKKIRVREYNDYGPKTIAAGHLLHLLTDFEVDTRAISYPGMATEMLRLLHPTSAVCGMPKASALEFIERNEGYDRSLYSGYWGPTGEQINLYVNLRCAQILPGGTARLFAGAGITADSDSAQEYAETQNKMKTIGKVLGVYI